MANPTTTTLSIEQLRCVLNAFKEAVELEGDARIAALDELCGRDFDVRARVENMLAWDLERMRARFSPSATRTPTQGGP